MRKNKSRLRIRISFIIAFVLLSGCRNIIILVRTAPLTEDVYFQSYSDKSLETTIYKYDIQTKTVQEMGRVSGYFHNCVIDSGKKYITGVRSSFFPIQISDSESDLQFGVVRFSLENNTLELLRSEEQLSIGEEESIVWNYSFPYGDGNKICICYKGQETHYILYDLKTGNAKRMDLLEAKRRVCGIWDNHIWYLTKRGLMCYHMKTHERKELLKGISWCSVSDNGRKAACFKKDAKCIYLYDIARQKKQCILKAGWNRAFESNSLYALGWDQNGNYCYYIEHFVELFQSSDIRIKIYNLQTKKSTCIYLHRNAPASTAYEFIRNTDESGGFSWDV